MLSVQIVSPDLPLPPPQPNRPLPLYRSLPIWTCPGLMDTPKSAKVSAEGVYGGEGRKA